MYPENYRGITVTNTFSTVLESLLKDRIEPTLLPKQSKLQRGFTEKASSLNTAFIVTQTADCYKELLRELFLLTLDAQKAFDKLNHEILFNNLYHDGICGGIWILLRNLYRNMSIQVKWNNSLSGEVKVTQGVRQGAKLSTMLYKRYNNNILKALERSDIGAEIGNIKVMAPTCADDIAVLAENQHEVQALLDIVENCTKRDLVTINPNKSDLVPITKCQSNFSVYLGKDEITQKSETKHLGLIRNSKNKLNTEDRLKLARKTLYALLGPGLHARKGMSPIVAYKIWKTDVIPRALYGIEVMNFTESDILKLERLQLKSHAIGNAHQIWKSVPNCHIEVKKAEVKARLLTGTYTLQVNKAKFSNNKETAKCKMCLNDTEDLEHFLLLCDSLDRRRTEKTLDHSKVLYRKKGTYKDLEKDGLLMKLILDSTCESVRTSIHLKKDNYTDIEQITRTFCYGLHVRRTYLLKDEI
ncbi:Hypothetical predicted protein [Mytilus galloprovincialis]|uniref:Reverse transcriptase domain-containing protein n=1 Tax=Mytilus galloprovincialis TaxID=29158 RepID=A0A8B6D5G7_MYTGA|nr:Hypothetical predicted protein [Mytilus galloprovincialis]